MKAQCRRNPNDVPDGVDEELYGQKGKIRELVWSTSNDLFWKLIEHPSREFDGPRGPLWSYPDTYFYVGEDSFVVNSFYWKNLTPGRGDKLVVEPRVLRRMGLANYTVLEAMWRRMGGR